MLILSTYITSKRQFFFLFQKLGADAPIGAYSPFSGPIKAQTSEKYYIMSINYIILLTVPGFEPGTAVLRAQFPDHCTTEDHNSNSLLIFRSSFANYLLYNYVFCTFPKILGQYYVTGNIHGAWCYIKWASKIAINQFTVPECVRSITTILYRFSAWFLRTLQNQ